MQSCCIKCGKPLSKDDIGAHRKLINRGATKYLCIECLAGHFKCDPQIIREKILYFKKSGCSLFQ